MSGYSTSAETVSVLLVAVARVPAHAKIHELIELGEKFSAMDVVPEKIVELTIR